MKIRDDTNEELSLYHDALDLVDSDTDNFPFSKFIRSANFALDAILRKIQKIDGRWQYADSNDTTLGIAVTDLVAGQEEYSLDDAYLKVRRIRIKNEQGDYVTIPAKDRRDLTDSELDGSGMPEGYDKMGRSIMPFPVPAHSADEGVEITFQKGSNYFTVADTDKEPGVDSVFHRYVSLYPAREYALKYAPKRLKAIDAQIKELDAEVVDHFNNRDTDEAPVLTLEETTEQY